MRIIGGTGRGTTLASVGKGDTTAHLRPTSDRVREALFNVLLGGRLELNINTARVLDLFAGTGALGLEALSRGAAEAVFVDDGRVAQKLIRENISKTHMGDKARLLPQDATRLLPNSSAGFDLIFLDPPYGQNLGEAALEAAKNGGWLAPNALIVWEENTPQFAPAGFALLEHRRYGETNITFLKRV